MPPKTHLSEFVHNGRLARRSATRRDVARKAGVSLTTVTHALNPPPGARVRQETRDRIQRVATELGYRPSFMGRALVSGRTYAVGLLEPRYDSVSYPLYQDIVVGMARAMEADDYSLMLLFRSDDSRYERVVRQGRVDGLFILQSDLETGHIDRMLEMDLPLVVVNKRFAPPGNHPAGNVCADHGRLLEDVVNELVAAGCRSILEVIDPRLIDANVCMHEAFLKAAAPHRDKGVVVSTINPQPDTFRLQIRNALASGQRWDGIFTDGIGPANVIVEEAADAGFRPREDFYLITSDIRNGITTGERAERCVYTQQPEQIGEAAWQVLRSFILGLATERIVKIPYRRQNVAAGRGTRREA